MRYYDDFMPPSDKSIRESDNMRLDSAKRWIEIVRDQRDSHLRPFSILQEAIIKFLPTFDLYKK